MRILILTEYFDPEPALIPSLRLAHFFESQGHEVEVLTGYPNYPAGKFYPGTKIRLWRKEVIDGVRVNRVLLYPSHDHSAIKRIASYLSFALSTTLIGSWLIQRPDVVYVYYTPPTVALSAVVWKKLRGVPYVLQAQDLWPESVIESGMITSGRIKGTIENLILKWASFVNRNSAGLVTISEGFKEKLVARGADESEVSVILNWTDELKFQPVARDEQLATQLGFSHKVNIVYSGNIGEYQGLEMAIEAASRVALDFPDFQLVLIGSGLARDRLVSEVEREGLTNVLILDRRPVEEMAKINGISDALLISLADVPFFSMTIPSKTQVSMACGRPIILAVTGDAATLVSKANAGLTCNAGDVDGLELVFRTFMEMAPEEREALGRNGLVYYQSELCLERGALRLLDLLVAAEVTQQ